MDKIRLEYEMKKKGISVSDLCDSLSISRASFYRKISGKTEFKLKEIQKITEILNLESPSPIFFAEKVS